MDYSGVNNRDQMARKDSGRERKRRRKRMQFKVS